MGGDPLVGLVVLPIWLAMCYSTPPTEAEKVHAEAEKVRAAAEKGDAEAQYELGAKYAAGQGVPRDGAEAAKWYQKSADQRFAPAQLRLAVLYETGFGVVQDNVQADMWYTIAASAEKTTVTAVNWRDDIEKRMTPEQIAEAKRRAQEWKPSTSPREAVRNPGNDPTSSMGVSP